MERETEVGQVIKCLSNEIRRCMVGRDAKRGITRMQALIIGYIYHEGQSRDIFQRDIEARFNIRRSTVAETLKLMEKNGLIKRMGVKEDARLKKLILTEKAEQIHSTVRSDIDKIESRLRSGISDSAIKSFVETAYKMQKNLSDLSVEYDREISCRGESDISDGVGE